jgi:succinyl-diaminopimelate desuccinylase
MPLAVFETIEWRIQPSKKVFLEKRYQKVKWRSILDLSNKFEFLSRLVEINSDSVLKTGYVECAELIKNEAEAIGLKTEVYDSAELAADKKPRPSVVARLDVGAKDTILLATHYDIVPAGGGWHYPPFKLTIEGDKAYGRGAADDKSSIVSALSAMRELKSTMPKANVVLLATPDEEVGGELGLGYLVNHVKIRGDAAIVLDASPTLISIGASGILWGRITVKGRQGHAGYPHLAENAIEKAIPLLEKLSKYAKIRERIRSKIPAPPGSLHRQVWGRFSLTMLSAGTKENVIPGECEVRFDIRVCPDEDYEEAKRVFTSYFERARSALKIDATLEYTLQNYSNYYTDPEQSIVKHFLKAAREAFGQDIPLAGTLGGNDGHYFAKVGIPVICFGAIRDECNFHGADEFVYLKDIELLKRALVNLVRDWRS